MVGVDNLILGGGLTGLAASYHLGHKNSLILEAKPHPYGHIFSEIRDGFTWDEGPHVSFTKSEYVRSLFEKSVGGQLEEYEVQAGNYYHGHWIDHPAQSNLYQVPEPLKSECLHSLLKERSNEKNKKAEPKNYGEWLKAAFGEVFARTFPAAYTRKYWTVEPDALATDWIGPRVFFPSVEDVVAGSKGPLDRQTHYIRKVRYPSAGGYTSFAGILTDDANIHRSCQVTSIDLKEKIVCDKKGREYRWKRLVNTLPLPVFLKMCRDVPVNVQAAMNKLSFTELLLVNIAVDGSSKRAENWIYVYDEDKYSTPINFTEKLSPTNAPAGTSGVKVEVYESASKPFQEPDEVIATHVVREIREMGIIESEASVRNVHTKRVPWANVVFTKQTKPALEEILTSLSSNGLEREPDDTDPLTDWEHKEDATLGNLILAGRYAQWKYFWTDDCVLRSQLWKV